MTTLTMSLQDAATMTRRDLLHALGSPGTVAVGLITPVFLLFLFVYVFGGAIRVGTSYVDYLVPGILLITATYGCGATAVRLASDVKEGIIDRVRTMAISRGAVLTGQVLGSLIRTAATIVLVFVLTLAVGFRPAAQPLAWVAAAALLLLVTIAVTWVTVAGALLATSPEGASYTTILVVLLPFVSRAFAPTASMPRWLQWFAEYQPFTPLSDTLRSLLLGTPVDAGQTVSSVLWCAGLTLVGYLGAKLLFARERVRA